LVSVEKKERSVNLMEKVIANDLLMDINEL
jgi:hypothetical protein